MNLLFVYDHYFTKFGDTVYSDKFPAYVFKRYLNTFDKINVWGRLNEVYTQPVDLPVASTDNVEFHFGSNISLLSSFYKRYSEKKRLIRQMESSDFIIARLPSEYGLMATKIAQNSNRPFIVEVVGCAWDALWNYGSSIGKVYAPVLYRRMQKAVAQADYVIYVSNQFLQKRYPAKENAVLTNISNVELEAVSTEVLKNRLSKIDKSRSVITLGTIGSLKTKYKGIHIALKALSQIKEINFEYRVLGGGNNEEYINLAKKLGVENKVVFDGTLPSGKPVLNWLDQLDLYLQPSFQEGLPRALLEALSRGCPSIGSTVGGIPELLDDQWLHKPGDDVQLANLIKKMISDNNKMQESAKRNFKTAQNYTKDILDNRRNTFLKKLAENPYH